MLQRILLQSAAYGNALFLVKWILENDMLSAFQNYFEFIWKKSCVINKHIAKATLKS